MEKLRLNVWDLVARGRRKLRGRVGGVTITLPFVSFDVAPTDPEVLAAREILIQLSDRRVLSAKECCDDCIDDALGSLHGIRSLLVEKQVFLAEASDGPVYLLVAFMLEPIRQFLTFEQRLRGVGNTNPNDPSFRRHPDVREAYFDGLETLRAHLHRCLLQLGKIAGIETPRISATLEYSREWDLDAYDEPRVLPPETG